MHGAIAIRTGRQGSGGLQGGCVVISGPSADAVSPAADGPPCVRTALEMLGCGCLLIEAGLNPPQLREHLIEGRFCALLLGGADLGCLLDEP